MGRVNLTTAESTVKEVAEESGYAVKVRKLAAAWDRTRQAHPSGVFSCIKLFYVCDVVGGTASAGPETSGVAWFSEVDLPGTLSLGRVLPNQLRRMFAHVRNPSLPTDFD